MNDYSKNAMDYKEVLFPGIKRFPSVLGKSGKLYFKAQSVAEYFGYANVEEALDEADLEHEYYVPQTHVNSSDGVKVETNLYFFDKFGVLDLVMRNPNYVGKSLKEKLYRLYDKNYPIKEEKIENQ